MKKFSTCSTASEHRAEAEAAADRDGIPSPFKSRAGILDCCLPPTRPQLAWRFAESGDEKTKFSENQIMIEGKLTGLLKPCRVESMRFSKREKP